MDVCKASRTVCIISGFVVVLLSGCTCADRAACCGQSSCEAGGDITRWSFERDEAGEVPSGWSIRETNPTKSPATWSVIEDDKAPSGKHVLALTHTENYNGTYNLAIADAPSLTDLDLTVRGKAVRGEEDQGGGPIWRCQDANNYYVCRFNPLESNFRVYVVKDGKRRQLASAKIESRPGRWYTVRATMVKDRITCFLDGLKRLEVTDDTITRGGRVGLWTKADAVTSFDDLGVRALGGS